MAVTKLLYDHLLDGGIDSKGIIKQVNNNEIQDVTTNYAVLMFKTQLDLGNIKL